MDLTRNDWIKLIRNYKEIIDIGKQFIDGLDFPKEKFGYPLAGTNWSGLLGEGGSPDCTFIDQIREAVLHK